MSVKQAPIEAPAEAGPGASGAQSAGPPAPEVRQPAPSPGRSDGAPPREPVAATPSDAKHAAKPAAKPDTGALEARLAELEARAAAAAEDSTSVKAKLEVAQKAMRSEVLGRLGVLDKFADFAPDVDAYTAEGRQALEEWAAANPELLSRRPSPTQNTGVKVADLVKGKPGGWMVRPDEWDRKLRGVN